MPRRAGAGKGAERRAPYSYRDDPSVPAFPDDRPVIVFDGDCVLCSEGARFVMRHDRGGRHRLAVVQSPLGRALYAHYGLDPDRTNLLLADGRALTRWDAVLGVARGLGAPWSWLAVTRVLPRALRDRGYGLLARNRFRWFGRRALCFRPQPEALDRFLA